jgi:hypothetical protein
MRALLTARLQEFAPVSVKAAIIAARCWPCYADSRALPHPPYNKGAIK